MTTPQTLNPVDIDAPLVNPAQIGLFTATIWTDEDTPLRWLPSGVDLRVFNYGGESAAGPWQPDWCAAEDDLGEEDVKQGTRPEFPNTFVPLTTWAADDCDLRESSRDEVELRSRQVHRLQEPLQVERHLAARMLTDATSPTAVADVVGAVSVLEAALAETNTVGMIHAGAQWAALAAQAQLIVRSGTSLRTPLGHMWVFGGGYVDALGTVLVATSPTLGWRGPVTTRPGPIVEVNEYHAVTERSLVIGYEHLVSAVDIGGSGAGEGEGESE